MDLNKFTILTCSFEQVRFQKSWRKSILRQKYRPLEVVFLDDFSSTEDYDCFMDHINLFEEKDINVITHRNESRLFCGASYSKALSLSTGDYLGVVDADDALEDDAISSVMQCYLKNPKAGFIYTQFLWCNQDLKSGRKGFCKLPPRGQNLLTAEFSQKTRHCYSHWRTFKRIKDVESIFLSKLRCSVDKYMGYRLEELAPGMFYDKICYKYRNGISTGVTKRKVDRYVEESSQDVVQKTKR